MLIRMLALIVIPFCLSGCLIYEYNTSLEDYEGSDRVGIAFDALNTGSIRVYQNVVGCVNVDNKGNRNIRGLFSGNDTKLIGVPEIPGMKKERKEFWLDGSSNIAIRRMYTRDTGYREKTTYTEGLSFRPVLGNYYYATIVNDKLFLFEISKDEKGNYIGRPKENLKLRTCPGASTFVGRKLQF